MTTGSLAQFHEISFPRDVADGCVFGPEYSTDIASLSSNGSEQRNINWAYPRCSGTINLPTQLNERFAEILTFFHICMGRGYGFRFYDYLDHSGSFEILGFGDGATTKFRLVKNYVRPEINVCQQRKILKPVAGTTHIYFKTYTEEQVKNFTWQYQTDIREEFASGIPDGAEQLLNYNLDNTTGVITFSTPPPANTVVLASYEFEVPVRFDTDKMAPNWSIVDASSWGSIPIIELKELS